MFALDVKTGKEKSGCRVPRRLAVRQLVDGEAVKLGSSWSCGVDVGAGKTGPLFKGTSRGLSRGGVFFHAGS